VNYSIVALCRNLEVSKAGYYAWRNRKPSARARKDAKLRTAIQSIHEQKRGLYGSPRIHAELKARKVRVARKRVARIMRMDGLKAKKRRHFTVTTVTSHSYPIAKNILAREFKPTQPNRAWVADITAFSTREGWLYLAVVLDLYSRRVIGWSMSAKIDAALVLNALRTAVAARRPGPGLIVHTDRGSQYACREYRAFVIANQIVPSMSRKGNCWDNAVAESFFSSLKTELKPERLWSTHSEARSAIFEYIETWYNRTRRHSTNQYLSPIDFESRRAFA
jgi:putative transposase